MTPYSDSRGNEGEKEVRPLRRRGYGVDADLLSRAAALELDGSRHAGEEGMVFTEADIETGEEFGPALAHDNGSSFDGFTPVCLDSEILRITIPPVSR